MTRKVGLPLLPSGPGGVRLPSIHSLWRKRDYAAARDEDKSFPEKPVKPLALKHFGRFKVRHQNLPGVSFAEFQPPIFPIS